MATLLLAEKPSVARDIARVMGAREHGEGFLRNQDTIVTWAVGHLVTLKEPDEIDEKYKRWKQEDLPILPDHLETKVIAKTRKQFTLIKKLMNDPEVQDLICATDSGREGELIFRYIYEQAGCKKPVRRLWISSMTDEAIRAGLDSMKPSSAYDALYRSARCRADADWLIGMNATRAYTLKYGVILSIGRVQTPTLGMLVRRRLEIDNFKPEPFFTVTADFGDYSGTYADANGERRISTKELAEEIAARAAHQQGIVTEVQKEKKVERPPLLYDLTTLQRDANIQHGFTAKKTLELAQKLYEEHKLLTYPRTDSRYLSHDMVDKVKATLGSYEGTLAEAGQKALRYGVRLLPRVFDDTKLTDHHAIIPTGKSAERARLTPDERTLYEMAAKRLAAVFFPNHQYEAVRVTTTVNEDRFISTGKTVLEPGWKELYPAEKGRKTAKEEEQALPELQEGEQRVCRQAKVKEDMTKPPKELNDASLLAGMEHAGREIEDEALREEMKDCALGTPATRAAIIERLIQVGYVQRKGKNLIATEKGVKLLSVVPSEISSAETTGRWEKALAEIARGEDREQRFREGIVRMTGFLVESAARGADAGFAAEERHTRSKKKRVPLGECPLCHTGEVFENSKGFYCGRYREGCAFTIWKDSLRRSGGPEITAKLMTLCLKNKDVRGSTGTIHCEGGSISFTPGK